MAGYYSTVNYSKVLGFLQYLVILNVLLSTWTRADVYRIPLKKMKTKANFENRLSGSLRMKRDGELTSKHGNLGGEPGLGYYIEMGIGTPPQKLNILVDTGSSNFAVAAAPDVNIDKYFNTSLSSTYSYDGTAVSVQYTQGEWNGPLAHDQVTAPSVPNLNISADIAFITDSSAFYQNGSHWQGILGMAYAEIIQPDGAAVVPFMDSLKQQSNLTDMFTLQLCGVKDTGNETAVSTGGTMTLGGLDSSLYKGPLLYADLRKEWYYEVIITDIQVAGESLKLDCKEYNFDRSIIDSGTTNLRLPPTVFKQTVSLLQRKIKILGSGGTIQQPPEDFWVGGSVICWEEMETPWLDLPTLTIQMAVNEDTTFDLVLSPQQYLLEVKDTYGGLFEEPNDCYKFAITPSDAGTVLGAILMEGYYVVFDRQEKRVGFAQTSCEISLTNAIPSTLQGPNSVKYNTSECGYVIPEPDTRAISAATYITIALLVVCALPLGLFLFQWFYHTHCRKQRPSSTPTHDENNLLETDFESRKSYMSFPGYR